MSSREITRITNKRKLRVNFTLVCLILECLSMSEASVSGVRMYYRLAKMKLRGDISENKR